MENHIQNIEIINKYLDKLLSENEIVDFENRLKTDVSFKEEYKAQVMFLEGLKRQALKVEIKNAKQSYVRNKWFRYLGISMVVLIASSLFLFNLKNPKAKENNIISTEVKSQKVVLDTVVADDVLTKKIIVQDTTKPEKVKIGNQKKGVNKVEIKKEITEINIPIKAPQIFGINASKDTIVECEEGTRLKVKANSFVNKNNEIITGEIALKITEYYKLSDVLLANLSTQSRGELLETGGMLFIEAKKNNSELKLSATSSVEILFPTKNKKADMQLFSGLWKNDNINWRLESAQDELEVIEIETVEEDIEVPFSVIEQVPIYPGCEGGNNMQQRNCTSNEVSKFVQRNFNTQIASNVGLSGRQRINVIFKIDPNGNVVDIRSRASDPDLEKEAERVIALLPKMSPGKQRGKTVSVPYSLPIIFQVDENTDMIANLGGDLRDRKRKLDSFYNKKLEDKLRANNIETITVSEVNGYLLRSSNLGWINCDRFVRRGNKIKYKIKVDNSYGTRINMIFKSMYSVLPSRKIGGVYDFSDVPNNEDVILVAIKKDNGKLYLDIVETTINENPNIKFNFKELSINELLNKLKVLDSLFN